MTVVTLPGLKATITPFDFGLLELDKPIGYIWKADCLGSNPAIGTSVGYIGRNKTCFIPTATVRGTVNTLDMDLINIDIIGVSRGTSGAPLIGPDGLIGVIVTAESVSADALTLDRLRNEVTNGGNFSFRFGLRRSTLIPQTPNNTTELNPGNQDLENWRNARTKGTRQAYQDYLTSYPDGTFTQRARDSIQAIDGRAEAQRRRAAEIKQEQDDWDLATELNTLKAYEDYLSKNPYGKNAPEARKRLNGKKEPQARSPAAALSKNLNEQPANWGQPEQVLSLSTKPGLKFDLDLLTVKAGSKVKLVFNNNDDMQHNLVVTVPGMANKVGEKGMGLGLKGPELHYVPNMAAVIANTKILEPGTTETIYFVAPSKPGDYQFVCTYPGHYLVMQGILRVLP